MTRKPEPPESAGAAAQVVGPAIQGLAVARLARGFVPFAVLVLLGLAGIVGGGGTESFLLALGAPLSAGAMLAFGLRVVQSAYRRPRRAWMAWVSVVGVLPPAYGIWVMAWLGLRRVAVGGGAPGETALGLVLTVLGLWALRAWLRIVELQRLAEAMSLPLPRSREEA